MQPGIVQIYGQNHWHDEAFIVADKEGLIALRAAIDKAIAQDASDSALWVSDGEGFHLHVLTVATESFEDILLPYVEWAGPGKHPTYLVKRAPQT